MDDPEYALDEITVDLARLRIGFVNVYFAGTPHDDGATAWTLVDAGLPVGATRVFEVAAARFGDTAPSAIILTHGHFDHVGALEALMRMWDVPVYAHRLELPYLTGRADYPPPDPTVGGGLMIRHSPLFTERGVNLGERARPLPAGGRVPGMSGWRWIHTPGHSPGHVSLYRAADRTLLAGDAVTTTRPESVFSTLTQWPEVNGPPTYFTIDWEKARQSVAALARLKPALVAAGHGDPIGGETLAADLAALASGFDSRARPARGRYVDQPAVTDEHGVVALPPPVRSSGVRWGALSGVAAGAFAATWAYRRFGKGQKSKAKD